MKFSKGNFRVEQDQDSLWVVYPSANSAVLAVGKTPEKAVLSAVREMTAFADDAFRAIQKWRDDNPDSATG